MKICIVGVGRSGTTSLYVLARHLMLSSGLSTRTYYEPLLWGERTWNRDYSEIAASFASIECTSIEGLAVHKRLPLFVDNPRSVPDVVYLERLFNPPQRDVHVLLKFIRACGRLSLLRSISPETKIIYVIRDPLSVVNSLASNFSAFGEGYYPSDYDRFLREVRQRFNDADAQISRFERFGIVGAQALYWLFCNHHAIEYIGTLEPDGEAMVVNAESISAQGGAFPRLLAGYLGLTWHDRFAEVASRPSGRVTEGVCIEPELVRAMDPLLDYYEEIVKQFVPGAAFNRDRIVEKFSDASSRRPVSISFENFTASRLRRTIKSDQDELASLSGELSDARQENQRLMERLMQFELRVRALEGELDKSRESLAASRHDSQRLVKRNADVEQRVGALEGQLSKSRESLSASQQEGARLEKRIGYMEQRLRTVESELSRTRESLMDSQRECQRLAGRNTEIEGQLGRIHTNVREIRRSWWKQWLLRRLFPYDSTFPD